MVTSDVVKMLVTARSLMDDLWYTDETMRWKERADKYPQVDLLLEQVINILTSDVNNT